MACFEYLIILKHSLKIVCILLVEFAFMPYSFILHLGYRGRLSEHDDEHVSGIIALAGWVSHLQDAHSSRTRGALPAGAGPQRAAVFRTARGGRTGVRLRGCGL